MLVSRCARVMALALLIAANCRGASAATVASSEEAAIQADIPAINTKLGSQVFLSIRIKDSLVFKYVVDEAAWASLSPATRRRLTQPGGWPFDETVKTYRRFHHGRVCIGEDDSLMLWIVNPRGVEQGLDYIVYVQTNEC
jgi:hypothetical protein